MADLTITAANVGVSTKSTKLIIVQVGEAVTQGQPGYATSDDEYFRADADDTELKAKASGIFMTAAAANKYAIFATGGSVDVGATLAIGETYVVSDTVGGIKPIGDLASGDYVTHLGVASATNQLDIDINATGAQVP